MIVACGMIKQVIFFRFRYVLVRKDKESACKVSQNDLTLECEANGNKCYGGTCLRAIYLYI